jgi:uncharacterized protein (DUF1330 family)
MTKVRVLLIAAMSMALGFLIGGAALQTVAAQTTVQAAVKPAYLVASSRPIHPDQMAPYRAAAGPLATKAGLEILGSGNPAAHVLEGTWAHEGTLTIERYRSMEDLLAFWNSPAYQEAKKLRAGNVEMNFIVAIEGR